MAKLHELLAALDDIRRKAVLLKDETIHLFKSKSESFDGMVKIYTPYEEDSKDLIEPVVVNIVTTVSDKINYLKSSLIMALDSELTLDETNCFGKATADLVIEGVKFGTFSASSLLDLEKYLSVIRDVYKNIPTLDNTMKWQSDTYDGKNILITSFQESYRSIKVTQPIVKYAHTDKHPAQTELIQVSVPVGSYKTVHKSGRISSATKAALLDRIEMIIREVKAARSRANNTDIVKVAIGEKLFDFINKDML